MRPRIRFVALACLTVAVPIATDACLLEFEGAPELALSFAFALGDDRSVDNAALEVQRAELSIGPIRLVGCEASPPHRESLLRQSMLPLARAHHPTTAASELHGSRRMVMDPSAMTTELGSIVPSPGSYCALRVVVAPPDTSAEALALDGRWFRDSRSGSFEARGIGQRNLELALRSPLSVGPETPEARHLRIVFDPVGALATVPVIDRDRWDLGLDVMVELDGALSVEPFR